MERVDVEAMRPLSKALFGEGLRLPLALAIARHESGVFTQTELAEELGLVNSSSVVNSVKHLVEAGLVLRHDASPNERARYLQRQDSSFWQFVEEQAIAIARFSQQKF